MTRATPDMDISQFSPSKLQGTSPLGVQSADANEQQSVDQDQSCTKSHESLLNFLANWQDDIILAQFFHFQTYIGSKMTLESRLKVSFDGLKDVYEKTQIRVGRNSKQRFVKGTGRLKITVASEAQIESIEVYVERVSEAAALCGDKNGQVPLKILKLEKFHCSKQTFAIDLDTVYESPKGTLVYKLSTVDASRRNRFRLVVVVVFIDGTRSKPFYSKQFCLKSKAKEPKEPRNHYRA